MRKHVRDMVMKLSIRDLRTLIKEEFQCLHEGRSLTITREQVKADIELMAQINKLMALAGDTRGKVTQEVSDQIDEVISYTTQLYYDQGRTDVNDESEMLGHSLLLGLLDAVEKNWKRPSALQETVINHIINVAMLSVDDDTDEIRTSRR